jgi:hypothetical protein
MKPTNGRLRSPSPAKGLEGLAGQIHRSFVRLEDAGTPGGIQAEAARAFALHYREYLALGGKPFQSSENGLTDLIILEERCRGRVPARRPERLTSPPNGEWSQPMKKAEIRKALGLDNYYTLSRLVEEGVYRLRQDPKNRQRWAIRLDTLDAETRRRFSKT